MAENRKININDASKEEIMNSVEGVGEETAQKLVDSENRKINLKMRKISMKFVESPQR